MKKIYKDGEVLEAADLNASLAELEEKINSLLYPQWKPVRLREGWFAVAGHTPQYCVIGKTVILTGAVERRVGGAQTAVLDVGSEACPSSTIFAGATVTSKGTVAEMYINPEGKMATESYSNVGGNLFVMPISCSYQLLNKE